MSQGLASVLLRGMALTSRTLTTLPTLDQAMDLVQQASCASVNTSLEGQLVHLTCPLMTLNDNNLGNNDALIPQPLSGLQLDAYTQIYQWDEFAFTKKVGNRNERDWMYFREWMDRLPPRNESFREGGRVCQTKNQEALPCYQWNPQVVEPWWNATGYTVGWQTVDTATNITVGEYVISFLPNLRTSHVDWTPTVVTPVCNNSTICTTEDDSTYLDQHVVVWQQVDSNGQRIDYMTRQYRLYTADTISILARQRGNTLEPWKFQPAQVGKKDELYEFLPGEYTAAEMIAASHSGVSPRFTTQWMWWVTAGVLLICWS